MKTSFLAATLLALAATPALAQVDLTDTPLAYRYFHRVGADLATHDAELVDCLRKGAQTVTMSQAMRRQKYYYVDLQDLTEWTITGALTSAQQRQNVLLNAENCMVVKGWDVVTVSDALGAKLMKLTPAEVANDFLAQRVGQPVVTGGIIRSWGNDAANPETERFGTGPRIAAKPLLSLKALDPQRLRDGIARPWPKPFDNKMPDTAKPRLLGAGQVAGIPPGSAVIVTRLKGVGSGAGTGFTFERVGADPDVPAWAADGRVAAFQISQSSLAGKPEGKFFAIVAPPGEWRLASMGVLPLLNFCLGSPSFQVKAGEILFAGTFDMGGMPFKPDMEMIAARQFLKARPDLAEQLKPAVWTNGSTGRCGDSVIYAIEFDGAPFAEGYVDGGARKAEPATP